MGKGLKSWSIILCMMTILLCSCSAELDNNIPQDSEIFLTRCISLSDGDGRCIRQDLCLQPKETQQTANPNECPSVDGYIYVCCPKVVNAIPKKIPISTPPASPYYSNMAYNVRSMTEEEIKVANFNPPQNCRPDYIYRTVEGNCNNLKNPLWGKSFEPMRRLLPSKYADGYSAPRVAVDGSPLPSARLVSEKTIPDVDNTHERISLLTMQFGQFMDHEFALAPTYANSTNPITCCSGPTASHPECFPIKVDKDDPFYNEHQQTCIEFVRSRAYPNNPSEFKPREQFSVLTAYIDGSNIYGSTIKGADNLRAYNNGLLATWKNPRGGVPNPTINITFGPGDYLPKGSHEFCREQPIQGDICFEAGDERVNEQPSLTVMHTLWMREHNRVAKGLKLKNPFWSDEKLFQEARRIVIAELQQITYNEFLPALLGRNLVKKHNLSLQESGYSTSYDDKVDASIINEFAAAAYRVGHTLLQAFYKVQFDYQSGGLSQTRIEHHQLRHFFFNPRFVPQPKYLEGFLKALHKNGIQKFDKSVTREVTRHLFQNQTSQFGMDLVSLNVQRARDHGIPTYNDLREYCGLGRAKTFEDLADLISEEQICAFKALYKSVDDIELFPAGVSERPLSDAVVGPTFGCVIAEQFFRLKVGDRFWFENGNQIYSFRAEQLQQIRKVTMARIICDNTALRSIQPWAFLQGRNLGNAERGCETIPAMSLDPWINV
jgi:peroxidase